MSVAILIGLVVVVLILGWKRPPGGG